MMEEKVTVSNVLSTNIETSKGENKGESRKMSERRCSARF